MTLSEISIRRPVFAWMLMAALILFGCISFKRMGISQLPDVDFPVLSISVGYEGAAPEVMESEVVDPIEDAVMTVQGIRNVSSSSRYGSASVTLEFDLERNIDTALQEVQTRIAQAQRLLPREIDPPVITKTNPEDQPILWLTVSSAADSVPTRELMRYVRDQLKDRFSTLPGVGEVFLGGYVDPNIRLWASSDRLRRYELSVGDILNTIRQEHTELPAGQIETERREYDVRTLGEAETVDQLSKIGISERGGRPSFVTIPLKDVVRIEEGLAEARRLSRFNQKPAIGLGIRKQRGANAVAVAKAVRRQMEKLRPQLPPGIELNLNFDTTQYIEESVGELNFTLVLSALLTGLVCWFFLGSWSSTFNVLLAIPTSIIGTFTFLHFMGFTLNTFTLLGLSLAIGIVVDDAIMVLENIVRHAEMGKSRLKAALEGSVEITFAAIAATVAIAAIFLPVVFMKGAIGRFFFQFGITLTAAVFLSLLEALTLTPMRCSQFLATSKTHAAGSMARRVDRIFAGWEKLYLRSLSWSLAHRWKVIGAASLFLVFSFGSVRLLKKEFVPAQDQGRFMMRLQTPVDSSLQYTDGKFREAEALLAARPEVQRYYAAVGGFGGGEVNTGIIFVTLKPRGKRGNNPATGDEWTQQELMDDLKTLLRQVKDTKVFAQDLSMRGFSASRGFPLEFSVRGSDWELLASAAEKIRSELEATGLVSDLDWDYKLGKPEVQVFPDRTRAAQRGVSVRAISEAIQALVGGVNVGKYSSGGRRYDIRVRLEPGERSRAEQIRQIQVRNNRGELLPLSDVVTIREKPSLSQINRYNRERAISLFANIPAGRSQADAIAAVQSISARLLPAGYKVVMSGSSETFKESFGDLGFALILGIAVAYMVLASQFNSFIDPVSVLLAMPFSISGAFLALLIAGQSLNIYSFIGLILLMGIVKKNSILLVDFTNQALAGGKRRVHEALLEACPGRLRPILMTSFSTIAGAIPPALALGPGAETRIPMAVTIIGGVLVSTILTLFVVPCAYSLFSRWQKSKLASGAGVAALLMAFSAGAEASTAPIRLQDALSEALARQPQLEGARRRLEQAQADEGRAFATAFPIVNANFGVTSRKDAVLSNFVRFDGEPYNAYSANIQASQPLLVFGFFSGIAVSRTDRELRALELEAATRDLSINVIRAFYQVLLSQRLVETLSEIERIQKETLATAQKRQSIGRGQLLDVLQARTQVALLEPRIAQARSQLQIAAQELATLLGRNDPQILTVSGSLDVRRTTEISQALETLEKDLLASDLGLVPELGQARLRRERVGQQRATVIGQNFPSIRATGEIARQSFVRTDLLSNSANAWNVGVTLTIPLFSGLSILQERRSFEAQARQFEADELAALQNASLERVRSQETLRMTRRNLESSERAWELSKESLDEARRNYRLATIDILQLLQVQQAFQDAQQALEQARFDHLQALARMCRAVGVSLTRLTQVL